MDIFEADDNSTPLTTDEKDGLKTKLILIMKLQFIFIINLFRFILFQMEMGVFQD